MRIPVKITTMLVGTMVALTSFLPSASATSSPDADRATADTATQLAQTTDSGPHRVSPKTETVSPGTYLIKYSLDSGHRTVKLDLRIGTDYSLSTTQHPSALALKNRSGMTIDTVDLSNLAANRGIVFTSLSWKLVNSREATLTISENQVQSTSDSSNVDARRARAPHKAWYNCMTDAGISGAIAGAVAGCAATIEIGCVEGAIAGIGPSGIAPMIAALWTCRSKY